MIYKLLRNGRKTSAIYIWTNFGIGDDKGVKFFTQTRTKIIKLWSGEHTLAIINNMATKFGGEEPISAELIHVRRARILNMTS